MDTRMKITALFLMIALTGCTGKPPENLGVVRGKLSPCPESPNCVSSRSTDETHQIAPLKATLEDVRQALLKMKRVRIITENDTYIHAEFTSAVMRFVDDAEFLYDPDARLVHVRSASRLGRSDFGVNRKHIEAIRASLKTSPPAR
ncbi:hypothetical protein DENIS_0780 [Desulfonema ishimotonii]|uniref:DUF1499 domain-containing protein n=1 Tax=Desulfonema ishimotonii TaxID=45657 RepID=A0A401FS97_9BACT|nr:DUF1499 domain-containing protein [Desulfonema ishimotonii]GBC59839.1 hypothetical protein DENIS_0780 [Desulfonema ishimotonii]